MSVTTKRKPKARVINTTFEELREQVIRKWEEDLKTMSKEELAEKLTTYEPGVPHYWFGRSVEPLTKEELLAHWNGGPEPEIHYKDEAPEPKAEREKAGERPVNARQ